MSGHHQWDPELVGVPQENGIASRFRFWLGAHADEPGTDLLRRLLDYGVGDCGFDADAFVWELADSIIGDHYPEPDRMLRHTEQIVHRYLVRELCGDDPAVGRFELFAVEGGTAAMCYIFNTLLINRLLHRGDKIAIMVPIFTPYLEIPELDEYGFEVVHVEATVTDEDGAHLWQFPDSEIDKLRDPSVRALFCVNPTNPPSVRLADATLQRIAEIVETDNAGAHGHHRRRLRDLHRRLPLAAGGDPPAHHRRVLVLEVRRGHRVAARSGRGARGQRLRRAAGRLAS